MGKKEEIKDYLMKNYIAKVFIISLVFLTSCSHTELRKAGKEQSLNSLLNIAKKMNNSGDYPMTIKLCRQIISLDSKHLNAQLLLVEALKSLNQYEEAVKILKNMINSDPKNLALKKNLGKLYIISNQPDDSIELLLSVYKDYPKDVSVINNLGIGYDIIGKHHDAQNYYKKALEIDSKNIDVLSNLGLSLTLSGDSVKGISILKGIADDPKATNANKQTLAIAYSIVGKLTKAKKIFQENLDQTSTRNNLAYIHLINPSIKVK